MNLCKNGNVEVPYRNIQNMYSGKQENQYNINLLYDYKTDVFKDYGFNTCIKMTPVDQPIYLNNTKKFLSYSYILPINQTDISAEYVISLYAYVSEDCNANFRMYLEHSCIYTQTYLNNTNNITDSTKGKVIWVWAKIKPNQTDGKIYIMFYPCPGLENTFTKGYQLITGITVYKGTEVIKPMNSSVSGNGIIQEITPKFYQNNITASNYLEL